MVKFRLIARKHCGKPILLKRHTYQKFNLFKRHMPQVIKEKADQLLMRGADRLSCFTVEICY